jgi:hypothetical protein
MPATADPVLPVIRHHTARFAVFPNCRISLSTPVINTAAAKAEQLYSAPGADPERLAKAPSEA